MLKNGDRVTIVRSPYSSVRNGTEAVIEEIRPDHFGPQQHLYILSGLPHKLFRVYELQPNGALD